ncbi:MAG TPA: EAL domain-containing protein [Actinomycetota bacterium]|nr:EAL domain-containing protein [Actinomycetota bacterium]
MVRIRVMVAEDEFPVREAIVGLIGDGDGIRVVATARDADEAIARAIEARPDVALLDVRMPGGGGVRAAREILRRLPGVRVIALSAYRDRESVLEMLRAGATSYVTKDADPEELVDAIRRAMGREGEPMPFAGHVLQGVDPHLDPEEASARMERIGRVLGDGGPRLVFQPVVRLATGGVAGYEALARFPGGGRGPDEWFAEAATVGSLVELELATARLALEHLERIPGGGLLFLNLSPSSITSPALLRALEGAAAHRVVLEVTERAPVADYPALREALDALRRAGARFAVDDAGAGWASLQHVLELSPDFIKLDRALVRGVEDDRSRRALVEGLLPVAAGMDAQVIAEGIEGAAQLEALRALGVPLGQGFFLGRPAELPPLEDGVRSATA